MRSASRLPPRRAFGITGAGAPSRHVDGVRSREGVGSVSTIESEVRHSVRPLRVVLVNDFEVVARGLEAMLRPHADRVQIVEVEVGGPPTVPCDIALLDTFGGRRQALERARRIVEQGIAGHVVLYTWDAHDEFLAAAREVGVTGVLLKSSSARELVEGLERIAAGEAIGLHNGHAIHNLTPREREVLAMLGLGLSNREIANALYLGVETVRTYVRRVYQKLGVSNRTQAALQVQRLGLEPVSPETPSPETPSA